MLTSRRAWRRKARLGLAAACGALVLSGTGAAPAGADDVRSACAPSPHWRLEALDHYGDWERAGGVDLSVNACAWTTSDQWTFEVTQAATTGGYARSGWRVRAWVVNGDGTPTYRTVTVHVRVDHCPRTDRCANDVAGFEARMRLVRDEYIRQVITDTTLVETGSSHRGWRLARG
jgi:hypothetical protein